MSDFLGMDYQVCVLDTPADRQLLGRLLEKTLNVPRPDAMRYAAAAPGVLPVRMTDAAATTLAEQLREEGFDAECIASSAIPRLADAEVVHHVRCLPEGLEILGLNAAPQKTIPWTDVEMIAVGDIPQGSASRYVDDEVLLTAARRSPRSSTAVHLNRGPDLWIVTRGSITGLRIHHHQMNYEYLDGRLTTSSTINFQRLVADLIRFAPQAFCPPATQACVAQCSPTLFSFESADEFEHWSVLHLLHHRRTSERKPSSLPTWKSPGTAGEIWHCLHCGCIRPGSDVESPPLCCHEPMTLAAGDLQRCW